MLSKYAAKSVLLALRLHYLRLPQHSLTLKPVRPMPFVDTPFNTSDVSSYAKHAPRMALRLRSRLTPSPTADCTSYVPRRSPETSTHTPSIPGTVRYFPSGDNPFRRGDSRSTGRSRQPHYQRVPRPHCLLNRPDPPPRPSLSGGHVPMCPKSRGFWNIAPKSPCSKLSHFPGNLEHRSGSVGRQKCSLDGSCRRTGRRCDKPPVASYRPSFSPSNCCTRVAHHIRRPEVNASYGGIARDSPFRDVSSRPADGETRRQPRRQIVETEEAICRCNREPGHTERLRRVA